MNTSIACILFFRNALCDTYWTQNNNDLPKTTIVFYWEVGLKSLAEESLFGEEKVTASLGDCALKVILYLKYTFIKHSPLWAWKVAGGLWSALIHFGYSEFQIVFTAKEATKCSLKLLKPLQQHHPSSLLSVCSRQFYQNTATTLLWRCAIDSGDIELRKFWWWFDTLTLIIRIHCNRHKFKLTIATVLWNDRHHISCCFTTNFKPKEGSAWYSKDFWWIITSEFDSAICITPSLEVPSIYFESFWGKT